MSDWRDEEMARRNAGQIRALSQNAHEEINARHYPGTRQLCVECDAPTGRCEEDSIYVEDIGPLCEACLDAVVAADQEMVRKLDAAMVDGQPPRIKLSDVPPHATIRPSGIDGVSFVEIDHVVYFVDRDFDLPATEEELSKYLERCEVCGQQWRDGSLHADCPNAPTHSRGGQG